MPTALDTADEESDDRVARMRAMLRELIFTRFDMLSAPLSERIAQADGAALDALFDRAVMVERTEKI